jgi:hypothetical protein
MCAAAWSAPSSDSSTVESENALTRAGFDNPYVSYFDHGAQGLSLMIDFDSRETTFPAIESEAERAARTVWENAPGRIAKIDVYATYDDFVDVPPTFSWTDERLREEFGPRPAVLDTFVPADVGVSPDSVIGWLVVGLLVCAFVVVLGLDRHRRRRPVAESTVYGPPATGWYGDGAQPGAMPPDSNAPDGDVWAPPGW